MIFRISGGEKRSVLQSITSDQATPTGSDLQLMERFRQENPWGLATSIDLQGCNPASIRSAEKIRVFVDELCALIEMNKFGPTTIVEFGADPRVSGFSMTQLIETSLISGHFANQSNAAYIDIFSCKFYLPHLAAEFAKAFFEARTFNLSINFRY